MRFLCLYMPDPTLPPPTPERMAKIGAFVESERRAGRLLATEGFQPSPKDVRVRLSGGKLTVTDGPFTEAKEVIGGFAVMEFPSRDAVIEGAKQFLEVVGGGTSEIHELPPMPPEKLAQ